MIVICFRRSDPRLIGCEVPGCTDDSCTRCGQTVCVAPATRDGIAAAGEPCQIVCVQCLGAEECAAATEVRITPKQEREVLKHFASQN